MKPADPILLVDDEEQLRKSVRFTLKSAGWNNLLECSDSRKVPGLAAGSKFSLILLDNKMPHRTGMDLLGELTELQPDVPIIMLTAVNDTAEIVECMRSGAFDCLVKPVEKKLLVSRVQRGLEYARVQARNRDLMASLQRANEELNRQAREQDAMVEKLKKTSYQLNSILDSSWAAILLVDSEGKIIRANKRAGRFFNLEFSEYLYRPFPEYISRIKSCFSDPDRLEFVVRQHMEKGGERPNADEWVPLDLENRLELSQPAKRTLSIVCSPISPREDRELGYLWIFRDISDVIRSEGYLNTIVSASPVPLLISSLSEGKFLYVNTHLARLVGVPQDELIGRHTVEFYFDPSEREHVLAELKANGKVDRRELKIRVAEGNYRWVVLSLVVARLQNQDVIVGGLYEITELKAALDKAEKARRNLLEAQSQLVQSEKMASLGNLVAGVAHEINNPIGAINSASDLIDRAFKKFASEDEKVGSMARLAQVIGEPIAVIKEGGVRIAKIVSSLRNFSRLDESEWQKADLHEGLESTLTLIHYKFKNKIKVIREYGDLPRVYCSAGQLNQVFMNVFSNACQAIADRGTVSIRTGMESGKAVIRISDSGKGIPEKDLSNIFNPGFTTKSRGVGTGLGLSICYKIMENHKGSIAVESRVGKGSTFILTLPISR